MNGQKHLIKCRCVLPQFKRQANPPQHQFTVFSVIGDDDVVKPKYAQCPNCGIIHKVVEISKSEIVPKEAMGTLVTIDDIKASLPEGLVSILEKNQADLPSWESAQFIYENQQWGNFVLLTTETEGSIKQGKYVRILGERIFKVETFERDEAIK